MPYLWRTIYGVGSIVLIQLIKSLLDKNFPQSQVFHHNLLSNLQIFLLLGVVVTLMLEMVLIRAYCRKKARQLSIIIFLCMLSVPEVLFIYWINNPASIPSTLLPSTTMFYDFLKRNVIQFEDQFSRYDSSLFYTLNPSTTFVFHNVEFADTYRINKASLRDDDTSLVHPEIISVGDSYAMGWGVQQQETYGQQLEKLTGRKVLNASMSSYGTARELKLLDRLDTSNLKYFIIQYCSNDNEENMEFVSHQYSLPISGEKTYDSLKQVHFWSKVYFPFKYSFTIAKLQVSNKLVEYNYRKLPAEPDSAEYKAGVAAQCFLNIFLHSRINFQKTKVFVMDINEYDKLSDLFINRINVLIKNNLYKQHFRSNFITVPVKDILKKQDYYILDKHIRPSGHLKIAERLRQYLFSNQ